MGMEKETSNSIRLAIALIAMAFVLTVTYALISLYEHLGDITDLLSGVKSLVLNNKVTSIVLVLACVIFVMQLKRRDALESDSVTVYNSVTKYLDGCKGSRAWITGISDEFLPGDYLVSTVDGKELNLLDYIFRYKDNTVRNNIVIHKGKGYPLKGVAEIQGSFYKIGHCWISREAMYFTPGEKVDRMIYALDANVYKVSNGYVIMSCED